MEDYLDRLLLTLGGSPRQVRHTLAEVEAHLHDAVAAGIAAGLPEHEAQAADQARIGPVHAVTGRIAAFSRPSAALIRRTALAGSLVGGVALGSFTAGILGLAVLAAFWWMRRRWQDRSTLTALPVGSAEAAGVILARAA